MFTTPAHIYLRVVVFTSFIFSISSGQNCDAGTEWNSDLSACVDCSPGYAAGATTSQEPCLACDRGRYNDQNAQESCIACLAGFYNDQTMRTAIVDWYVFSQF
jgi:hypothetical protein